MARLILDTGVIIAGVRGQLDVTALADTDDVALPALAVAEYLAGTLLDADRARSVAQRAFLDEVLQVLPVHDYDQDVVTHHATLLAHVQQTGRKRGAHDLIIAATACATNRIVVTTDERAQFAELPGVSARLVST
ncbi:PIN domain-containing protein [Ruania zhangjianzhongii]|uniref:PIN domain-containing protein n=1 Tax=Ruania zhangjianzhongii TaxID=2603206 RepID=UPI0011C7A673|nr:PIN domain-containing protein [Ruania zhangjianzhongii]